MMTEKRSKESKKEVVRTNPTPPSLPPSSPAIDDPWGEFGDGDSPAHASAPAATGPPEGPAEPTPEDIYPHLAQAEVELRRGTERIGGGLVAQPVRSIITPVTNVAEAVRAWGLFNELKERLLTKDDYYMVKGPKPRVAPTRTGWRKLALFFGVSADIVEEKRWQRGATFGYDFMVKAVAPNGQSMVGVGSCDSEDIKRTSKGALPITEHNVRAKAHTRALNRAISDLIGGGELSAEEVEGEETE